MFVARVAAGDSHVGRPGLLVPDRRPGSAERYSSTVDRLPSPSIYVTYHDAQALPEYLVTFCDTSCESETCDSDAEPGDPPAAFIWASGAAAGPYSAIAGAAAQPGSSHHSSPSRESRHPSAAHRDPLWNPLAPPLPASPERAQRS